MSANIDFEIRKVIAGVFEIPEEGVQDEVNFYSTYDIDSLRLIEVVVELEKRFALSIPPPDLDLENIQTFGQLMNLVKQHINESHAIN